jgi:hypothetical protein
VYLETPRCKKLDIQRIFKEIEEEMKLGIGTETTDSIFQCISTNADIA